MIQLVDHKKFVMENKPIQQFLLDRLPGHEDKMFDTLDKALQRFNTILLKLSEEPLLAEQHNLEVLDCQNAIHHFYSYTKKLINTNNWLCKMYYRTCLHGIGINKIPKIRKLLNKLDN
tara:strand:- start:1167 stop:1520 length:354 start_codon:yes stop_codon:yes gene_type:complete